MCARFFTDIYEFNPKPRCTSEWTIWWLSFALEIPYEAAPKAILDRIRKCIPKPRNAGKKGKKAVATGLIDQGTPSAQNPALSMDEEPKIQKAEKVVTLKGIQTQSSRGKISEHTTTEGEAQKTKPKEELFEVIFKLIDPALPSRCIFI